MYQLIGGGVALLASAALTLRNSGTQQTEGAKETDEEIKSRTGLVEMRKFNFPAGQNIAMAHQRFPHIKEGTAVKIVDTAETRAYKGEGPNARGTGGAKVRTRLSDATKEVYYREIGDYLGVSTGRVFVDASIGFLEVRDFDNEVAYVAFDLIETDSRGLQFANRDWTSKASDSVFDFVKGLFNGLGELSDPIMMKITIRLSANGVTFGSGDSDIVLTYDWGDTCLGSYASVRNHGALSTRNAHDLNSYTLGVIGFFDSYLRNQNWGFVQGTPETGTIEFWFDVKKTKQSAGVDICTQGISICQHTSRSGLVPFQIETNNGICTTCPDGQSSLGSIATKTWLRTTRKTHAFDVMKQSLYRENGEIRIFRDGEIIGTSVQRKNGLQFIHGIDDRLLVFPLNSVRIV